MGTQKQDAYVTILIQLDRRRIGAPRTEAKKDGGFGKRSEAVRWSDVCLTFLRIGVNPCFLFVWFFVYCGLSFPALLRFKVP